MPPTTSVDRYDDVRRAWIATHQGVSTIQRRRAEVLGRRVRARQRARASALPDPHDDTIIPPLWLRTAKSPAAQLELIGVLALAAVAPVGWAMGKALHCIVSRWIPDTLRSYPIPALLWSGAALTAPILLVYQPGESLAATLMTPWLCAQLAATPSIAGVYGIAEGWLAVAGSDQWWPLAPARTPITASEADDILGGYDTVGPAIVSAAPLNEVGERTRP